MGHLRRVAPFVAALLLAAACGDDDSDDASSAAPSSSQETASSADGPPESTGATGSLTLDAPLKLVLLAEISGESDFAINDFDEGFQIACAEINDAGGVGGHPVECSRVATSILPQDAVNDVRKALEEDPTIFIGLAGPDQLAAVLPIIDENEVPTLSITTNDNLFGATAASSWVFNVLPRGSGVAETGFRFLVEEFDAKKVASVHTNEPFGNGAAETQKNLAPELGVEFGPERSIAIDATDLTEEVLAMKSADADAVLAWMYPNPFVILLQQMLANDLRIPIMDADTVSTVVNFQLATGEAIANLYGVDACLPMKDQTPAAQRFAALYDASEFAGNSIPGGLLAGTYDAVHIAVAAVEAAGSTDPTGIRDALEGTVEHDGVCGRPYRSDGGHTMAHHLQVQFWGTGQPEVVAEYDVPLG